VIDRFIKVTKSLEGNLAERARGRLAACTASPSVYDDLRRAADVAATPYAIAVSMVLDQIDDKRVALLIALKKNRVVVGRDILADIDACESALLGAIRELDASEWGTRLHTIRDSIVELVEAEVRRFPDEVGHILKLRDVRGDRFLSDLVWKGRDAISDGATFCKRLTGQA
jgi:hypothetical protein